MSRSRQAISLPAWPISDGHPVLERVQPWTGWLPPAVVHVIPSLSLGGAERIVVDAAHAAATTGAAVHVAVMRDADKTHAVPVHPNLHVHHFGHMEWPERLSRLAVLVAATGLPAMCHLTSVAEMRALWASGLDTIPVVHNVEEGWTQDPAEWDRARVPLVVACGERVARHLEARVLDIPVVPLRHVVPSPLPMSPNRRRQVRKALGARKDTLLVGMVGRVVPQKAHARAIGVLASLVERGIDARLVVVGAIQGLDGRRCHAAAVSAAVETGVRDRLTFLGGIRDASTLVPAFDVHLNVSAFEGVSIATMEAVAAGVPVVSLQAGGQDEAISKDDVLLPQSASPDEIADAVSEAASRPRSLPVARDAFVAWSGMSWNWIAAYRALARSPVPRSLDVFFVTGNMDVGGAQRSLCNLAAGMARKGLRVAVGISGAIGVPDFMTEAVEAGVAFVDLSSSGGHLHGLCGRAGRVLSYALRSNPTSLCFWNMDAVTKAAVAKVVVGSGIRVADASPGPALFRELDEAEPALRLLTSSRKAYLTSLDAFVSKYAGGLPDVLERPHAVRVIPNGVGGARPLLDEDSPRPPVGTPRERAVLVVGRLNATKKISLLPRIARDLARRIPDATITVVGGVHAGGAMKGTMPANLHFLPPDTRASSFAHRFACMLMLSTEQGCPNASLEAMAAGIPVVANDDGGTSEQVIDGVTGRLLLSEDDASLVSEAVEALAGLLREEGGAEEMGKRAKAHVHRNFTMASMVEAYTDVLLRGR